MPTKAQLEVKVAELKATNLELESIIKTRNSSIKADAKTISSLEFDLKNAHGKIDRLQKAEAQTNENAHKFIKLSWAKRMLMTRARMRTWITKTSVFGK